MYVVGLTGGIGSGKSTLAALLAERGAQVIDADLLGRDALRPGKPAWHSVVDQFGDEILVANSFDIDRKRLAAVVFNDRDKLAALNAIVHPLILRAVADQLERLRKTDEVVVLDAALIIETGLDEAVDALIVVDAPEELRLERVLLNRDMSRAEVGARMGSQSSRRDVLDRADIVVDNSGSIEQLAAEADRVWQELVNRGAAIGRFREEPGGGESWRS
jgi:dephospho-CoA kinase